MPLFFLPIPERRRKMPLSSRGPSPPSLLSGIAVSGIGEREDPSPHPLVGASPTPSFSRSHKYCTLHPTTLWASITEVFVLSIAFFALSRSSQVAEPVVC